MMYHALRGIGDDGSGEAGDEGSNIPGSPTTYESPTNSTGTIPNYFGFPTTPTQTSPSVPTGNASTGFNWGGFFAGIFPTIAADATKIGQQAIATPGTVITPQGTIAVGTAQGQPSIGSVGVTSSLSSMMPLLLLAGGAVVLVMIVKK